MTRPIPVGFAAAVLLLAPAPGFAQRGGPLEDARQPAGVSGDGTEVFRWLLATNGIRPLSQAEILEHVKDQNFGDTVVIVLGKGDTDAVLEYSGLDLTRYAVRHGGAALVASDTELHFGGLLRDRVSGVSVSGRQVSGTPFTLNFSRNTKCPFVVPATPPDGRDAPEWQLFGGPSPLRVATNAPSYIRTSFRGRDDVFRSTLAVFPPGCLVLDPFNNDRFDPEPHPFAVGSSGMAPGSKLPYRFLALADPSVFINEMMVPNPAAGEVSDNLEFASRVVGFLSDRGDGEPRTKCIFLQNGQLVTSYEDLRELLRPPPPPIPLPSLDKLQPKLVDAGNQILDRLQANNVLNTALLGRTPERQTRRLRDVMTGVLVVACIYSAWFVLRRVWGARQPTDVPPAPPGGRPPTAPGVPQPGVFDRRQRELLRRNNVYEPVRVAVREMFAAAGAPAAAGPKLPKVVISDVVRRPDTLRAALAELWKIGYGRPRAVTAQRWAVLEPLFGRARQAHADGKWRFVVDQHVGSGGEA